MNYPSTPTGLDALAEILRLRCESRIKPESDKFEHRVVLVLGAGVSIGAGLPLWSDKDLRRSILYAAEQHYRDMNRFTLEAWLKLGPSLGLPPRAPDEEVRRAGDALLAKANLDQLCGVACADPVLREDILDVLEKKFAPWLHKETNGGEVSAGPPPQLSCELIAHLVKHGFIDHVITFNFDEILDSAIANEMGSEDYVRLMSDHYVSEDDPSKPHLIKLHGTISLRETLRFTTDRTGTLPQQHVALLDRVLFRESENGKPLAVHIISLGYSWQDRDFAHYVHSRREHIEDVTVVLRSRDEQNRVLIRTDGPLDQEISGESTPQSRPFERSVLGLVDLTNQSSDTRQPSIDLLLWAVWKKLRDELKTEYSVMSAARHCVLAFLFGLDGWIDRKSQKPDGRLHGNRSDEALNNHTRTKRFLAELLLHTVECKGMVNLSCMARNCRLSRFKPLPIPTIDDFLVASGFLQRSTAADVKETYFATRRHKAEFLTELKNHFNHDAKVVLPELVGGRLELKGPIDAESFLEQQLAQTFDGEEVEIVPSCDNRASWAFIKPIKLGTYLELQDKTRMLLEHHEWTHLLVVAETGAWMTQGPMKELLAAMEGASVLSIETSTRGLEDWHLRDEISRQLQADREELLKKVNCTILSSQLAWWKHNRHLTLACSKKGNCFRGGIYFRRSLKASQIAPVYLDDDRDCAELLLTFLAYAKRIIEEIEEERATPSDGIPSRPPGSIGDCLRMLDETQKIARYLPCRVRAVQDKRDELVDRIRSFVDNEKAAVSSAVPPATLATP